SRPALKVGDSVREARWAWGRFSNGATRKSTSSQPPCGAGGKMLSFGRKNILLASIAAAAVSFGAATQAPGVILINELDSDTPGSDVAEFIELYNTATTAAMSDGLVLTSFNGSN